MIISVVVLISYLVYFLSSLAFGLSELNRTAVDYWHADGVILSQASNKSLYASSIDQSLAINLGFDPSEFVNLASVNVTINDPENAVSLILLGLDNLDGSWNAPIIEGTTIKNDYDLILSSNIRDKQKVQLGDKVTLEDNGRVFTVVGFTKNSNYNTIPVAYANLEFVSKEMLMYKTGDASIDASTSPTPNMPKRIAGILVKGPVDEVALKENKLLYLPIDTFINTLPGYQPQVLTFGLMIISLSIIAAVVLGIFMYILTMQKKSIFGILKIQGYRNGYIIRSIFYQVTVITLIGLLIGLGLTLVTVSFLPASVPIAFNWTLLTMVSLFIIVTSLIGSIFSALSVLKIDPLEAL